MLYLDSWRVYHVRIFEILTNYGELARAYRVVCC
jgi:hypothetical protein